MIVTNAAYHNGLLEHSEPSEQEEGQNVQSQNKPNIMPTLQKRVLTQAELQVIEQIKQASSLEELHRIINASPIREPDILEAINNSRRETGFRIPDQG
jgi:hypothetical protein